MLKLFLKVNSFRLLTIMMSTLSQPDADLIPGETFRYLIVLQNVLVSVDGSLNEFLEVLSMIDDRLSAEEVYLDRLAENYRILLAYYRNLFANHRRQYRCLGDILRNVLHEMANPRSLLEISSIAVSNYRLLTYELPRELERQLQEIEEKTSILDHSIEYLKHGVRSLFLDVVSYMSDFESDFDIFR